MADFSKTVVYRIEADTKNASKNLSELDQRLDEVSSSAKAADKAVDGVSTVTTKMGNSVKFGGGEAGKLANVLKLVSPNAAEAARTLGDTSEAASALGMAVRTGNPYVIAAGAAIAVAGAAWYVYQGQAEQAKKKQKALNDEIDKANQTLESVTERTEQNNKIAKLYLSGTVDEIKQGELLYAARSLNSSALEKERKDYLDAEAAIDAYMKRSIRSNAGLKELTDLRDIEKRQFLQMQKAADDNVQSELNLADAKEGRAAATDAANKAESAGIKLDDEAKAKLKADQEKEYNEALKEQTELLAQINKEIGIAASIEQRANGIKSSAIAEQLEGREKILQIQAQEMANLAEMQAVLDEQVGGDIEEKAAAQAEIDKALYETKKSNAMELREFDKKAAEEKKKQTLDQLNSTIGAADQMFAILAEHSKAAFVAQKAVAIGEIGMNTAVAIARQFKDLPLPAAIATSVVVGGLGAAQMAKVVAQQPPTYHTGGEIDGAGQVQITAQRGESVLTRAATQRLGKDNVNALNAGMGSGSPTVVQMVYKHQIFDSFVSDNLKRNGTLGKALKNKKYGQV